MEEERRISPAVLIIPVGIGLGAAALVGLAALAREEEAPPEEAPPPGRATFYGRVTDSVTGELLADVLVTLNSLEFYTDAGGNYAFTDLEPGSYTIAFGKGGYETVVSDIILVEGNNELNIQMAPLAAPLSYGPLSVAIVSYPPAPGWWTPVVHCKVTNPSSSKLSAIIKLKLYESYYYDGPVERFYESPGQTFEIPAGGSIDYLYDGTEITSPILLESGGGYIVISWQLWLEDNYGGRSEVYEFTT